MIDKYIPVFANDESSDCLGRKLISTDRSFKKPFSVLTSIKRSRPDIRAKMVAIQERVRSMNRERNSLLDEISRQLISEFGWGSGPASNNVAGMIREFQ